MIYLEKDQLSFLIAISGTDKLLRDDISDQQWKMLKFLEDEKLIDIHRKILRYQLNPETSKATPIYGAMKSVSISEQGKAYLAEMRLSEENAKQEQIQKREFMDSVKQIAESAETQANIAVKTSKKADIKGWIAVLFSGIALLIEFAANHEEILEYINQILKLIQSK